MLGTPEELGPIFTRSPATEPYPEVMNAGAIDEIDALDPDAVVVKGDLTEPRHRGGVRGVPATRTPVSATRMHHVRGNHDAMITEQIAATGPVRRRARPASRSRCSTRCGPAPISGRVPADQLEWLDDARGGVDHAGARVRPPPPVGSRARTNATTRTSASIPTTAKRCARSSRAASRSAGTSPGTRIAIVCAASPQARNVPIVEIACVKDYPGAWAEYRVHEGGYTQLVRRITTPAAMAWTEKTRHMFAGLYRDYALGALATAASPKPSSGRPDAGARRAARHRHGDGVRRARARPVTSPTSAPTSIKVEAPGGDGVRRMGWFPPEGGDSYTWKLLGADKRAVVLDLKTDAGLDAMLALVDDADVLIENFRPGTLERLGLGPDGAARAQPGPRGPARHRLRSGRSVRVAARLRDDGRGDERVRGDQRRARRPAAAPADRAHRRGRRARRRVRGDGRAARTATAPARAR